MQETQKESMRVVHGREIGFEKQFHMDVSELRTFFQKKKKKKKGMSFFGKIMNYLVGEVLVKSLGKQSHIS
jgi:hypothetical protein